MYIPFCCASHGYIQTFDDHFRYHPLYSKEYKLIDKQSKSIEYMTHYVQYCIDKKWNIEECRLYLYFTMTHTPQSFSISYLRVLDILQNKDSEFTYEFINTMSLDMSFKYITLHLTLNISEHAHKRKQILYFSHQPLLHSIHSPVIDVLQNRDIMRHIIEFI